jgi:hypothetical protein
VSKHPRISGWPARATENPLQIEKWCAQYPSANWAIHTTKINVVDLDRKPGKPDGVLTLQSWEDTMNVQTPDGVRVTTGTGVQIYFLPTPGLKTTANPDGTGIDVRAAGGYVMCPGSRHANGNVYEITVDEGMEACPKWLVERISGKTGLQQNQQDSIRGNTSYSQWRGRVGVGVDSRRFQIRPDAELSPEEWGRIYQLGSNLPKFDSTWKVARATSPWPFRDGRNSPSEYEGSISFFLVWDGWAEQAVMDAICCWRRQCGLAAPTQYSRYACTIGKAVVMVTPRSKGLGETRKESKGLYRHAYTKERILGCIIDTPRSPKQIADYTGLERAHVKVVIGRLRKDGMVIRDNHTYLCAPTAVPWYVQNIPEDAGEDSGEELITPEDAQVDLDALEAEYAAAVAAGMFEDSVEEEIEAPLGFAPAAAVYIKPTLPDFDDYVEPELVTVEPAPIEYPAYDERDFGTYASRAAALAEWEVHWKQENRDRLREFRKRPNYNSLAELKREAKAKKLARGYASRFAPSQVDLDIARINEIARLKEKNNEVP